MMPEAEKVNVNLLEATKRFVIDRKGIGFFKAILESYEDLAIFSVVDGKAGLIEIIYPTHFEQDIIAIIHDMKNYGIDFKEAENV
jgi:flavorubredoxin